MEYSIAVLSAINNDRKSIKLAKNIIKALSMLKPRKNMAIAINWAAVLVLAKKVTLVASDKECWAECSLNALTQNSLARITAEIAPRKGSLVIRIIVKSANRTKILSAIGSSIAPSEDSTL